MEENAMHLEDLIARLARQAETIQRLVRGVTDEQARWKPASDQWSMLEVINHLADEEIEDFRAHLDFILHHPDQPWPRIDPQAWVVERGYNRRAIGESLARFLAARRESLDWLRRLDSPDWDATFEAPFGRISAGDMAASWAAHDLLHTRQLVELHWVYTTQQVAPYRVEYAGAW
jgi:hypothetical protein